MEHRPEQDERMEEMPEAEVLTESGTARAEEATEGMVPESGAMELEQQHTEDVSTATRFTEVLTLPKVDRGAAPATPTIRPGEASTVTTPATGTKSKSERKQEKKAARKEEKRNKRAEKSARKAEAEKAEETPSVSKTPVRRKLDVAMENAGSIESVLLLEREYKGKKKGLIKLTKLREEEEAEAAQPEAEAEVLDEGAASRKRKLDELEQKKKALEAENAKKQKEIEDEAKRILAVEEAERRAKEQRAKNPKLQVPVAAEKSEKPETWFERKSAELVESFIQGCTPQQKRAREAEAAYADACRGAENAQASFIEALQQAQNCAEQLQTRMAQEDAEKPSKKEDPGKSDGGKPTSSQPGPFWGPHAKIQPAEETKGKEWREKVYEDEWKLDVRSGAMRSNLPRTFYPFSPEWQEKVQKTLWHLAHRGFNLNSEGEQAPVRPYPWQLHSYREFREINDDLQNRFGIRLIWRAQECKGRSRAMDEWHCYPIGRGKMEKTDRAGNPDKYKDEKDEYQKYYPAISFADYGAISSQIRDINKKFLEEKRKNPEQYPEIEPPEDERGEESVSSGDGVVPYAVSKKAAKPAASGQSKTMANRENDLLEMQDSAKKRRGKVLEKGSDKAQKTEVVDVEDDATSKKSSGKGKGTIWTSEPPLPA
ncbi:unnamed protein product, partial [Symbiodinium sp. KB8]